MTELYWLFVYEPNELCDFQLLDYSPREREVQLSKEDYIRCGVYARERMLIVSADNSSSARRKAIQLLVR
ncbi:hypothetical protein HM1_1975 [Heliomicrobium modesticaldum Ice1]|uniref:Uncharacterized protein n=1 Tax=Heliobacterium modesticaldum (strain ATCC 51547 / Ice1) TaxID=498761 RepID=B0TFV3_HELMI|nr:hypothetical protein HM1_1975 [Heliomicrobium modesticaldum Ice1]